MRTACDEESSCFRIMRQHFAELSDNMFEDVGRCIVQQWLECWQVHALLQDVLQCFLRFVLEIFRGVRSQVALQKFGQHVRDGDCLSVFRCVTSDLSESPGASSLHEVKMNYRTKLI